MIKNNTSIIILGIIMLIGFYLLYDNQDSTEQKLIILEKQLSDLDSKINFTPKVAGVDYKQKNTVQDEDINANTVSTKKIRLKYIGHDSELNEQDTALSIKNKLSEFDSFEEDSLLKDFFTYRSSSNDDVKELKNDAQELDSRIDELEIELNNMLENIQKEALDTLCYGLDEKYKIINFSKNAARLRDRGRPGSKLVYIKDTLSYDGFKYVLLEVNSTRGYMLFMDINNSIQKDCYFFKD